MDKMNMMPFPLPALDDEPQMPNEQMKPSGPSFNHSLLALAMGFVPMQAWEEPYDTDLALTRGTLFPSLDKPFIGEEAVSK